MKQVQSRSRSRLLDAESLEGDSFELIVCLSGAPEGTRIIGPLWSRASYEYPCKGTTMKGKVIDSKIQIDICRTSKAFGARVWRIYPPEGFVGVSYVPDNLHCGKSAYSLKPISWEGV